MTDRSPTIGQQAAAANKVAGVLGYAGAVAATCPRTAVEIGIFFDGTGNNEVNVGRGTNFSTDDSYASTRSNVSLLKDLYKVSEESEWEQDVGGYCRKFAAIYKSGIGTTDEEDDDTVGFAAGMGPTGIESRVYEACLEVGREIARLSPTAEPTEIVLDVFGFSRGAAAARYFVNCFRQGFIRYDAYEWNIWRVLLSPFASVRIDRRRAGVPDGRNIRIRFLGIFDTVAAFGLGGNDYGEVNVHLSTAQADRIYHLTARHEYRAKFSLDHSIPGGGDTRQMIGAHSDVGGGYGDGTENQLVEREDTRTFMNRDEAEASRASDAALAETSMTDPTSPWVRDGWIQEGDPDDALQVVVSPVRVEPIMTFAPLTGVGIFIPPPLIYSYSKSVRIRRDVSAGLSRIPLRIMYDAAVGAAVPLRPYPSMAVLYAPPPGFPPGAAETLIAGNEPPVEVQHEILRRFGHISARFDTITDADGGFAGWIDTYKERLAHSPENAWARTVYDNDEGRAK